MSQRRSSQPRRSIGSFVTARPSDSRNGGNATPLLAAVEARHLDIAKQLLAAGADPKAKILEGPSMLAYAVGCRDPKMISKLRAAGAPVYDKVREVAAKRGMKFD